MNVRPSAAECIGWPIREMSPRHGKLRAPGWHGPRRIAREIGAPHVASPAVRDDGHVPEGSYLICHDDVTHGSVIANLRGHLIHQGGDVRLATALAVNILSSNLVPDPTALIGISARFRHELSTITTHLGFDYDRLTSREAYFIYGLKDLECIRNPATPSHRVAGPKLRCGEA